MKKVLMMVLGTIVFSNLVASPCFSVETCVEVLSHCKRGYERVLANANIHTCMNCYSWCAEAKDVCRPNDQQAKDYYQRCKNQPNCP
jgi:hypothetical protein